MNRSQTRRQRKRLTDDYVRSMNVKVRNGVSLTEEAIPFIRHRILHRHSKVYGPRPEKLPPWREVNHEMNWTDESINYRYHLPRCPEALQDQLRDKIDRYVRAGWWSEQTSPQAAPMLCVFKKDGKSLRTVFDCRKRNDNTVKDVTPFPDQERIRHDVARAKYRSKLDMSEAFEQVRVVEKDIWKTAFATTQGTYVSHVMQQGDTNAPATFQRLMTCIFRKHIGRFMHVYLDDIFVFSDSIEEHEKHLDIVFGILDKEELYLSEDKIDLFSTRMDCLGHVITDEGIHASSEKLEKLRKWPRPRDYDEIRRFLGLVNYLGNFLPDISSYTTPLSNCTRNGRSFEWTPLMDKCFETIKILAIRTPILKPINPSLPEPIWVVSDASIAGVGAFYGQGADWKTCTPAGIMSRAFTSTQMVYFTWEQEVLGVLEALMKWEDQLMGRKIRIITDHKTIEFFTRQKNLSPRQMRWYTYISRFNFEVVYVKGEENVVADALSRYYLNPSAKPDITDLVSSDARLDEDGDDLPLGRLEEYHSLRAAALRRSTRVSRPSIRILRDRESSRAEEAAALIVEPVIVTEFSSATPRELQIDDDDLLVIEHGPASSKTPVLPVQLSSIDWKSIIVPCYKDDPVFAKILANPPAFPKYHISNTDKLVYTENTSGKRVLCIPRKAKLGDQFVYQILLNEAHLAIGHMSVFPTSDYLRRAYWWPKMGDDIEKFCKSCAICQSSKSSNAHPSGLLHHLPIPNRPWESIGMDFVGPLPPSLQPGDPREYNYLIVFIDRLTSLVHLVPTQTTITAKDLAWIYLDTVIRAHGLPKSIVSDRDPKFTSKFWRELQRIFNTRLLMSTAYHPQTDGATERANRSIAQVLRTMVSPEQVDWAEQLPLVEFALNSTISSTTGYTPFEATYGFTPEFGVVGESVYKGVSHFAQQARWNIICAHDSIIEHRVFQTHHANKTRSPESPLLERGSLVWLSTKNLSLPKNRAHKLLPKWIGPFPIAKYDQTTSTATLGLPDSMVKRKIHTVFHTSLLRPHVPNDDDRFPARKNEVFYDFGSDLDGETLVDAIIGHTWEKNTIKFRVQWADGDVTWETLSNVSNLAALDEYLALHDAKQPRDLARRSA
jgi:hypothetical protein